MATAENHSEPSCIFSSVAGHHSVLQSPDGQARGHQLKEWLHADDAIKIALYESNKLSKPKLKIFHVDGILAEHGYLCKRIPPYQP
jgi:hypothetical protein